ncbi:MAG: HD domain-containing protein [Chloroflexi bacterium]|nr:HD domain-containing protein [Chloroflexota bacterium]
MRRVSIHHAEPGMVLARAIFNERGDTLLNASVALTDRYIQYLKDRGYVFLYISDGLTDDIEIEDIVSDRVRRVATRNLYRLYSTLEKASANLRAAPPSRLRAGLRSREFRESVADAEGYEDLVTDIKAIVDEVLGADVMTGLSSLRSHDSYLFFHALDAAIAAVMIGKRLHFDHHKLSQLAQGCIVMDIGNVFVDRAILQKPGPLTPEEVERVKQHPALGYELLRTMRGADPITNHIAYQHHERQDGKGYPRGLRGTNRIFRFSHERHERGRILLMAEIAAVADVYDALGSDRPHRRAFAPDAVARALRDLAGDHLNREIVQELLAILPVYPVGSDVVVKTGDLAGYRGVVARVDRVKLDRPIVRVLWNAKNERIDPIELDLRKLPDVVVTSVMS